MPNFDIIMKYPSDMSGSMRPKPLQEAAGGTDEPLQAVAGGTDMVGAFQTALVERQGATDEVRTIVIMTDGDPLVGIPTSPLPE